ncbi:unnamed protein product [Polarella glacialis]|uniref:Uncharacterized protein n=1 Tax=Polarella glacialis TaxID=89957 RepID=A0A813GDM2_POLGL|nr:unnamed protein product [Polarella glacialis]
MNARPWRQSLSTWASAKVEAAWFPYLLATMNFLDYFCLLGFFVPPLQSVAFANLTTKKSLMICGLCATGGFLGSGCLVVVLAHFDLMSGRITEAQAAYAGELLRSWGPLAGLINGCSPLPAIPLIVATAAVETSLWRVVLVLLLLHVGRYLKFVGLLVMIRSGKAALASSVVAGERVSPKSS